MGKRKINIDIYEEELNYILIGLELFNLNLNNIWAIDKDSDEQKQRNDINFYLYHRLLGYKNNFDYYCKEQNKKE